MSISLLICAILIVVIMTVRYVPAGIDSYKPLPYWIALLSLLPIPTAVLCIIAWVNTYYAQTTFNLLLCIVLMILLYIQVLPIFAYYPQFSRKKRDKQHPKREIAQEIVQSDKLCHTEHNNAPATIRILTVNCRYGKANAEDIARFVIDNDCHILALQELTQPLADAITQRLREVLPYTIQGATNKKNNGGWNALWTRYKPAHSAMYEIIPGADCAIANLEYPLTNTAYMPMAVVSVHTKSPMRSCAEWGEGIRGVHNVTSMPIMQAAANKGAIIALGDYNATIDHPSWRYLLHSGWQDASMLAQTGTHRTFPSNMPLLELDHCMIYHNNEHQIRVRRIETVVIHGTDHRGIFTDMIIT